MNCNGCKAPIIPGALLCGSCGMPAPLIAAVPSNAVKDLKVVEGGVMGASIPLPLEGGEMCLGRHDLLRSPPWVVDVDLGRLMQLSLGEGAPVSRDQAVLARRAGELLLTPRGNAPTLHKAAGATDYKPLTASQTQPIHPGDRVVFGHAGRALVLEAH
jgi:hypothetical protein